MKNEPEVLNEQNVYGYDAALNCPLPTKPSLLLLSVAKKEVLDHIGKTIGYGWHEDNLEATRKDLELGFNRLKEILEAMPAAHKRTYPEKHPIRKAFGSIISSLHYRLNRDYE